MLPLHETNMLDRWLVFLAVSMLPFWVFFALMFTDACHIDPTSMWYVHNSTGLFYVSEHIMRCNHTNEWGSVLPTLTTLLLPIILGVQYFTYCCASEAHKEQHYIDIEWSRLLFKVSAFTCAFGYACVVEYDHMPADKKIEVSSEEYQDFYLHAYGVGLLFGGFLITHMLAFYHYIHVHSEENQGTIFGVFTKPQFIRRVAYALIILICVTATIIFAVVFINGNDGTAIIMEYILIGCLVIVLVYNFYVLMRVYKTCPGTTMHQSPENQRLYRIMLYTLGCAVPVVGFLLIYDHIDLYDY